MGSLWRTGVTIRKQCMVLLSITRQVKHYPRTNSRNLRTKRPLWQDQWLVVNFISVNLIWNFTVPTIQLIRKKKVSSMFNNVSHQSIHHITCHLRKIDSYALSLIYLQEVTLLDTILTNGLRLCLRMHLVHLRMSVLIMRKKSRKWVHCLERLYYHWEVACPRWKYLRGSEDVNLHLMPC